MQRQSVIRLIGGLLGLAAAAAAAAIGPTPPSSAHAASLDARLGR